MRTKEQACGDRGEAAAAAHARAQGARVVAKNVRSPWGEVDLVLAHRGALAFAEVKTRGRADLGLGRDAVGRRKQRAIARTALHYVAEARIDLARVACRFDVFEVDATTLEVTWIQDAFEAPP